MCFWKIMLKVRCFKTTGDHRPFLSKFDVKLGSWGIIHTGEHSPLEVSTKPSHLPPGSSAGFTPRARSASLMDGMGWNIKSVLQISVYFVSILVMYIPIYNHVQSLSPTLEWVWNLQFQSDSSIYKSLQYIPDGLEWNGKEEGFFVEWLSYFVLFTDRCSYAITGSLSPPLYSVDAQIPQIVTYGLFEKIPSITP